MELVDKPSNLPGSFTFSSRARAELRRFDPFEVKETYQWARRVAETLGLTQGTADQHRLIAFAPIAALVRENTAPNIGKALKLARVKERHVRRLLAADRSDIDDQLVKIVRLLDRRVNVLDLVATSVFWGEKRIRSVAMDYFGGEDIEATATHAP